MNFPVWGTTARLLVTDARRMDAARRALDAEITAMGAACDRFRPDSELSRLNAAEGRPMRISALFAETLTQALRVAGATGGMVDPTVGSALIAAGYDRDFAEVRRREAASSGGESAGSGDEGARSGGEAADGEAVWSGGEAARTAPRRQTGAPRPIAGWPVVELDGQVVRVPRGVTIDLGATAKAFAADRAASRAAAAAGCGVLVGLGGDIAVGGPPPQDGWRIQVTDDHRAGPGAPGQDVTITEGGLATSSITVRRWRRGGRWLHHIIDPATGAPAGSYWRAVSVAAATCVDANAASTAAIVMGRDAAAWLANGCLPARLVRLDGTPLALAGWPAADTLGATA